MIAIIDYGAGNLRSVLSAFRRLNEPARITGEAAEIAAADGILDDMDYGADVTLTVSLPSERRETLQGRLTELSAGGLTLALMEESYRPGPREEL